MVQPVNVAPVVDDTSATTDEDTAVTVAPLGSDANDDALAYSVTQPSHGTAEVTADGLRYTPAPDYHGSDSFTYAAFDGQEVSNAATVSVTVNSVADALEADDTLVDTEEDQSVVVDPLAASPDGPVTFDLLTSPAHGTLQGSTAPWTYVPDADFHGADSFGYSVSSGGQVLNRTAFVTVTPVNDAPTAQGASEQTLEDIALTFTPQTGDVDADVLALSVVDPPTHGTAEVTPSGELRYEPDHDYVGADSFTYRASDGSLDSPEATVSVTVSPVNDLPTVGPVASFSATYSDAITPVTVAASDVETATGSLVFSAEGLPAGLGLSSTGTISGIVTAPPASYPVSVAVCDASEGCTTTGFTITVQPETAAVRLAPSNPHAVATGSAGAPAMTFTGRVTDSADGSFGDVTRIVPDGLRLALTPVGGGSAITCPVTVARRVAATATSPGYADVSCTFAAGVRSDVYDVTLAVSGSFTGSDASLLTVYDPRARGTSGAGSVQLANGNTGEFGFTATGDGKSVKGKFGFLERTPAGTIVSTVKGTALQTLTVGTGSPKPAAFTGKAVVNGVGNYGYVVSVTDAGATGDTFALRLTAPAGAPSRPWLSFLALPLQPGGAVTVR